MSRLFASVAEEYDRPVTQSIATQSQVALVTTLDQAEAC